MVSFVLILPTTLAYPEEPVNFPDENLEQAIRDAIGKQTGDIYPSDLEGLTLLDARDMGIEDLTGIEYCQDLTYLNLRENNISNISLLSNLTGLQKLTLSDNNISDLAPLSGLVNLGRLRLGYNSLDETIDIEPLSNLTNLYSLILGPNKIAGLEPLSNLTDLVALSLGGTPIDDISPISNLTQLQHLELIYTNVKSLDPLKNFENLEDLDIGHTGIGDISILTNLDKLECLEAGYNNIEDISPLKDLTNLESVYLQNNLIREITPLVENNGLGTGDQINLTNNYLDLSDGSEDMQNIQALLDRGTTVKYEPQKTDLLGPNQLIDLGQTIQLDISTTQESTSAAKPAPSTKITNVSWDINKPPNSTATLDSEFDSATFEPKTMGTYKLGVTATYESGKTVTDSTNILVPDETEKSIISASQAGLISETNGSNSLIHREDQANFVTKFTPENDEWKLGGDEEIEVTANLYNAIKRPASELSEFTPQKWDDLVATFTIILKDTDGNGKLEQEEIQNQLENNLWNQVKDQIEDELEEANKDQLKTYLTNTKFKERWTSMLANKVTQASSTGGGMVSTLSNWGGSAWNYASSNPVKIAVGTGLIVGGVACTAASSGICGPVGAGSVGKGAIMLGMVASPGDIEVVNEEGEIVSSDINEIDGASYEEKDFNGDGTKEKFVKLPSSSPYHLRITPYEGTSTPITSGVGVEGGMSAMIQRERDSSDLNQTANFSTTPGSFEEKMVNSLAEKLNEGMIDQEQLLVTLEKVISHFSNLTVIWQAIEEGLIELWKAIEQGLLAAGSVTALHSPADIEVIDSQNRKTGYKGGDKYAQIPGSKVLVKEHEVYLKLPKDTKDYEVIVTGTKSGNLTLELGMTEGGTVKGFQYKDVSVDVETSLKVESPDKNAEGTMEVDQDDDDSYEGERTPDNIVDTTRENYETVFIPNWNLFSPPGIPQNPDPGTALGDDIDSPSLFYNYSGGSYTKYPDTSTQLTWKKGYWTELGQKIKLDMAVNVPTGEKTLQFEQEGWHMIGVPYSVDWSQVDFSDTTDFQTDGAGNARLVAWSPEGTMYYNHYSDQSYVLSPWSGYWVKVKSTPASLTISESSSTPSSLSQRTPLPQSVDPTKLDYPPKPPSYTDTTKSVELLAYPNPVGSAQKVVFGLKGQTRGVQKTRVGVYATPGTRVWGDKTEGNTLTWNTKGVANGVYLYTGWVQVNGKWQELGVKKLLIIK